MSTPRMPPGSDKLRVNDDEESNEDEDEDSKDESKEEKEDNEDAKTNEDKDKGKNWNDEDNDSRRQNSRQQDSQERVGKDTASEELNSSKENRNMTEEYVNWISEIAMAIAETRGFKVSEDRIRADVNDVVIFQQKIIEVFLTQLLFYFFSLFFF